MPSVLMLGGPSNGKIARFRFPHRDLEIIAEHEVIEGGYRFTERTPLRYELREVVVYNQHFSVYVDPQDCSDEQLQRIVMSWHHSIEREMLDTCE